MTDPNVPPAQPAGQQPPAYSAPPPSYQAPQGGGTNVLAIIALIGAFLFPPVGIICGHIALGQIKRTGEQGHGLALWGTILGYVFTALWLLIIVLSVVLPLLFVASLPGAFYMG